ncbi:MAG: nitrogenase component 1 [Firmicutes bacterium]|nr:nitrogenase component 1 [Dethiobacter sp.]MBS3888349.1 nitrogenase component 1 [Bacillota bacterium]MBS4054513.1 nitrogenase component 1 [Thermaerobacter sp.]
MVLHANLSGLKRISQIETAKDIRPLSLAQFPGTHCPLFGVALTAGYIKDMIVLIVGTDECTYYTKNFNINRRAGDAAMQDNFLSFAMNQDDVVFGCAEKLRAVVRDIDKTYAPQAILLVTTCVIEVIGEDFTALASELQDEVQAKLLIVRTEHFKCNSHIPGIERCLTAFGELMGQSTVKPQTVNILGHRYPGINDAELMRLLTKKGVEINLAIPSACSVSELRHAPSAALNIVTDFTALALAASMEERFGTPFVYFEKYLCPERIRQGYRDIARHLNLDLEAEVAELCTELEALIAASKKVVAGKNFVYGNTPMLAFELSSFLASLGMEPLLIQARDLYGNDAAYIQEILSQGHDPYVARVANIAPLQAVYKELRPSLYIGHENPERLREYGVAQVAFDAAAAKLGFAVPLTVLKTLLRALDTANSGETRSVRYATV